jgi:hypothetical protein
MTILTPSPFPATRAHRPVGNHPSPSSRRGRRRQSPTLVGKVGAVLPRSHHWTVEPQGVAILLRLAGAGSSASMG